VGEGGYTDYLGMGGGRDDDDYRKAGRGVLSSEDELSLDCEINSG